MKYVCQKNKWCAKNPKNLKIGLSLFLSGILIFLIIADGFVRDIISGYPLSVSETIITEIMDESMNDVLNGDSVDPNLIGEIQYDKNGNVLGIETNTRELLSLKAEFMNAFRKKIKNYGNNIEISVPIGTLIGNEYTLGRGPKITFDLQFNCTLSTELKSKFTDAGVNNTLHTIELYATSTIFIIIPWGQSSKKISTKYILAETAIVGDVPEAFTNIHGADDEITDDIVDHGAELK